MEIEEALDAPEVASVTMPARKSKLGKRLLADVTEPKDDSDHDGIDDGIDDGAGGEENDRCLEPTEDRPAPLAMLRVPPPSTKIRGLLVPLTGSVVGIIVPTFDNAIPMITLSASFAEGN
jgi:hypothetical protein